jgi:hypothetical protein
MKWISHITLSGVVAYAATQDPLPAAAAAVGAVFPDKVEGTPGSVGWKSWRSRHRGWSHWPMLYIALLGILSHTSGYFFYDAAFFSILRWMLLGALMHIAEDAVCGKVSFLLPSQKIGVRLFTVGSFREYLFVLGCIALVYAASTLHGDL